MTTTQDKLAFKDKILEALRNNVLVFNYKKKDGTTRNAIGTLMKECLKYYDFIEELTPSPGEFLYHTRYWDLTKIDPEDDYVKGWCTFRTDHLVENPDGSWWTIDEELTNCFRNSRDHKLITATITKCQMVNDKRQGGIHHA